MILNGLTLDKTPCKVFVTSVYNAWVLIEGQHPWRCNNAGRLTDVYDKNFRYHLLGVTDNLSRSGISLELSTLRPGVEITVQGERCVLTANWPDTFSAAFLRVDASKKFLIDYDRLCTYEIDRTNEASLEVLSYYGR